MAALPAVEDAIERRSASAGIASKTFAGTKSQFPHTNRTLIEALHQGGVNMYECGVTMRKLGYEPKDILPVSRIVVSGMGALVDFEKSGYLPITP